MATHKCVFIAFGEYPQSDLIVIFCFIHLKNTSISHLCRYILAISYGENSKLFVMNVIISPVSIFSAFTIRKSPEYNLRDLACFMRTI